MTTAPHCPPASFTSYAVTLSQGYPDDDADLAIRRRYAQAAHAVAVMLSGGVVTDADLAAHNLTRTGVAAAAHDTASLLPIPFDPKPEMITLPENTGLWLGFGAILDVPAGTLDPFAVEEDR